MSGHIIEEAESLTNYSLNFTEARGVSLLSYINRETVSTPLQDDSGHELKVPLS